MHTRFFAHLARGFYVLLPVAYVFEVGITKAADEPNIKFSNPVHPENVDQGVKKSFDELFIQWESLREDLQDNMDRGLVVKSEKERQEVNRLHHIFLDSALLLKSEVTEAAIDEWRQRPDQSMKAAQWLIEFARIAIIEREWKLASRLSDVLLEHSKSLPQTDRQNVLEYSARSHFAQNDFRGAASSLELLKEYGPLPGDLPDVAKSIDAYIGLWEEELRIRKMESADENLIRVRMKTSKGTIIIVLFERAEPAATSGFVSLVESGFYNGLHLRPISREIALETFNINPDAQADARTKIQTRHDRYTYRSHFRGSVSMHHSDGLSDASRVAFMTSPSITFDKQRTVFGRVIEGMEVVDNLGKCDPDEATIFDVTVLGNSYR